MANSDKKTTNEMLQYIDLDTSGSIVLGNAHDATVGQIRLHVVVSGSGGSFIPKLRATGSGIDPADAIATVYYSCASETAIAAGVGSSAAGIYYIYADGCDVILAYTQSTGSMRIYFGPVQG